MNSSAKRVDETAPAPYVGMGATYCGWSDEHPYTVIEVSENGKRVVVQEDEARRVDGNGMSDCQRYLFIPNSNGQKFTVSLRKDGLWREVGGGKHARRFHLGRRRKFHDYSF